MSAVWRCDREGCGHWTQRADKAEFIQISDFSLSDGYNLHFCSWDCVLFYGANEPVKEWEMVTPDLGTEVVPYIEPELQLADEVDDEQ